MYLLDSAKSAENDVRATVDTADWFAGAWFTALQSALELVPCPAAVIDQNLSLRAMNKPASRLLALGDGLREVNGRIQADTCSQHKALVREVARVGDPLGGCASAYLLMHRESIRRPLDVTLTRVPCPSALAPHAPRGLVHVRIVDTEAPITLDRHRLRELFALTSREQDIACLLADGYSLCEASDVLCVSQQTVRSHLKQIFCKTGTHRQAALIRSLIQCAAWPSPTTP